jgi:NAD(P)H-hydrate epimerase
LPPRRADSHKGDYGRALLIGGSRGMSGAIALAGMAALRGGAGLVTLAVPEPCLDTVASFEPSYMTSPLPADRHGLVQVAATDAISKLADAATVIACGPGIGRSSQVSDLVKWMYEVLPQPLILDADALYALAQHPERLDEPGGTRIFTPHPGEFRRFVGDADLGRDELEQAAREKAADWGAVVLLKGHRTLVTDGRRDYHNTTGNPGMATGGSGDVLTGLITAMACQGLAAWDAARLGAYVHGRAGDLAAAQLGQTSLIASDLVRFLPDAFQWLHAGTGEAGVADQPDKVRE